MKALKYISEYFLGTETHKFYRNQRNFFREYVLDKDDLKKLLRGSV